MAINVTVVKENTDGDSEAPPIHDSMIVDEDMARLRGTRYLNDPNQGAYYAVKKRILRLQHRSAGVLPNRWVRINSSHLGLENQLMKVLRYRIEIAPDGVWGVLEADQYVEVL